MKLFFPDRDRLGRDPLEFLLRRADSAAAPMLPLGLGLRRNLLVADLSLINEGPFGADRLYIPFSPDDPSAPLAIVGDRQHRQTAGPRKGIDVKDRAKIIDHITKEVLSSLRRGIFSAYRHASFDCWRFSSSIAAKLTLVNLFSTDAVDAQAIFSHHAEIIHSLSDPIALDIILMNYNAMGQKTQTHFDSMQLLNA
jgi:hypothetical protein